MDVLLIDDSEIICDLYSELLGFRGDTVTSANDGKEGLNLAVKNEYDLILLDMSMPNYSGLDFLEDLNIQKPSDLKKVIVISRKDLDLNLTAKVEKFGIASIQKKPLDMIEIESSEPLIEN